LGTAGSTLGLCLPAGLCAFLLLVAGVSGGVALVVSVGALVFARLFPYLRNLLESARGAPAVTLARAKGAGEWAVVLRHVLRPSAPRLIALTSVAASVALGACVPLEMILDQPGIGQLAWQAAIARDLPLLVVVTWILAAVLMLLSALADGTEEGLSGA
jgi:peptide/nickel transport system permease protein